VCQGAGAWTWTARLQVWERPSPAPAHARLGHDASRGIVADVRDAGGPFQATADLAEVKCGPRGLGGEPVPRKWAASCQPIPRGMLNEVE
jgi:hypothetical protein